MKKVILGFGFVIFFAIMGGAQVKNSISIMGISDNTVVQSGLNKCGGFSCLVLGLDHPVLFDAAQYGDKLMKNFEKLNIEVGPIKTIFLSHKDKDHTRGVSSVLDVNPDVSIYVASDALKNKEFADTLKPYIGKIAVKAVSKDPLQIFSSVYSSGQLGSNNPEHSMVIKTPKGNIIITGCAHPGILEILDQVQKTIGGETLYVIGGFHLRDSSKEYIQNIIDGFKKRNIKYVSPTHCTGDLAGSMFKEAYGKQFTPFGIGSVIQIDDLP